VDIGVDLGIKDNKTNDFVLAQNGIGFLQFYSKCWDVPEKTFLIIHK